MAGDVVELDENGLVKLPKDRFFDPWRTAAEENVRQLVKEAVQMVLSYEDHFQSRKRKRRPLDQENFEALIESLLCDMMVCHLKGEKRGSAISLSKQVLSRKSMYRPPFFSKVLPSILNILSSHELGYLKQQKGRRQDFGDRGQRTLIWPAWRIIDRIMKFRVELRDIGRRNTEQVIILKSPKQDYWDEARYIEYHDTDQTRRYRAELHEINEWLERADIDVDEVSPSSVSGIDIRRRSMRRAFTRGSFDCGGRLFGGFWQEMSKVNRLSAIVINGEDVAELDYRQMAPRIVYGMAGVDPPDGDLYAIEGIDPKYREGIKVLFNSMLYAEKPLSKKPKGTSKLLPERSVKELCGKIIQRHALIADAFHKELGHVVQHIESQIIVKVLLRLKESGVVGLQLHDGMLVPVSSVTLASTIMERTALEMAGCPIPVSCSR